MGIRRDLDRALLGVRRPRICSAVSGTESVARRGTGERSCGFGKGRLLRKPDGRKGVDVGEREGLAGGESEGEVCFARS